MKSKKKLIIAMTSLISVFSIAIVAVVAIFAAQNQSVESQFRVKYTAVDISATVKANYIVGNVVTPMLTEEDEEELVFLPTSEEGGSLSPQEDNIELDTTDNSVVFEYIFTNNSNSIDVAIDLDTSGFVVDNMTVTYAYSYSRIENVSAMSTTEAFEPMMILGEAKENGVYETLYVYVKVKVSNIANDASFEGSMDFSLTKATPVKLSFEGVEDALNPGLLQSRIIPANTPIGSLPTPKFADGERYAWFEEEALETLVSYPFVASEDKVVYAGVQPYAATVLENGTTIIENYSEEPIYLTTKTNGTFKFGVSEYTNTDGAYILVNEGQSVTVPAGSGASNVNFASPVSASNVVTNISLTVPADLETKKFYAAYGAYPQTYVGNALNEELRNASLTETGKNYGFYKSRLGYVIEYNEYLYNGKKYIKYEDSDQTRDISQFGSYIPFSNGEEIIEGETYFFEVEPVVAKAMQKNENGTYTMQCLRMLFPSLTDVENSNNWENSYIRMCMNDESLLRDVGFADIVVETEVKNNTPGNVFDGSGDSTYDKIWIASLEEVLTWGGYELNEEYIISGGFPEIIYSREQYSLSYFSYGEHSDLLLVTGAIYYNGNCGSNYTFRTAGNTGVWGYFNETEDLSPSYGSFINSSHACFAVNV